MTRSSKKAPITSTTDIRSRAETLRSRAAAASGDPVLAVIADGRRLFPAARREYATGNGRDPQPTVMALFEHLRGPLLAAKPTTPAGAVALARYATDLRRVTGYDLADEAATLFAHIGDAPSA